MNTDPRITPVIDAIAKAANEWDDNPGTTVEERTIRLATAALAAADAVDPLRRPGHRVEIAEDSWTLQHPPECRANMLACPLNDAMRSMGLNGVAEGMYTVELTEGGSLFFPDEATL